MEDNEVLEHESHTESGSDIKPEYPTRGQDAPRERERTDGMPPVKPQVSVREHLRQAIADHQSQDETETSTEAPDQQPEPEATPEPAVETAPEEQPPQGAPASWTNANKKRFDELPMWAQKAIIKREADGDRGVSEIKAKYKPIDETRTQIQPVLDRLGVSFEDAVSGSVGYFAGLASPQKIPVAKKIIEQFGINPFHLLPLEWQQTLMNAHNGQQSNGHQQDNGYDQRDQLIMQMAQKIDSLEGSVNGNNVDTAKAYLNDWRKNTKHKKYLNTRVEDRMRGMWSSRPLLPNGHPDLDGLAEDAIWADPETRKQVQADQKAKEAAARKAQIEAKKAAAQSIPSNGYGGAINGRTPPRLSLREELKKNAREQGWDV